MEKNAFFRLIVISALLIGAGWLLHPQAFAKATICYSSSAQVYEALGTEVLSAFTEESGVEVDLFVGSSSAAVHRLMNGFADIASSVERLNFGYEEYGYVEVAFCRAPLIVISNVKTPVRSISGEQLRSVFNGTLTNWKELGGPDQKIVVVIPERNTGAYRNFSQLALKRFDVKYDYMAYRSTDVVELVHRIPWSISFITQGAHTVNEAVRIIQIDGKSPSDETYPFHQTFSFITKGQPASPAKKLIDFVFSDKGQAIIKKNGMSPTGR